MTDETLGVVFAQVTFVVAYAALAIGIGMGFWMSNKINGSADERTARLFSMICEADK